MERASGILLHPTSLPGGSIGDLGDEAYRFADWLAEAGQRVWQVLPLGPVGYGESPYQLFSAFAGNPMLIGGPGVEGGGSGSGARVEFEAVVPRKMAALRERWCRERGRAGSDDFPWLPEFARFMALKVANGGKPWWDWDARLQANHEEVEFQTWLQGEFFRQWRALKRHANDRGIRLMGDLPIYVAKDSADVWARPELFRFDAVAGVPPDYFSATGQLWGNPIYRWDRMREDGYRWWKERMRASFEMFDLVRVDHFRGFEAYWEVPAGEETAVNGRWVKGPGAEFFRAMKAELGPLPIVAENLGVITPEVEAIREEFGFPGMAILQFAFGKDPQAPTFQPHNYPRNLVAYTGTHDNDTVVGWWRSEGGDSTRTAEDVREEKAKARAYLGVGDEAPIHWVMIRELMKSVADIEIFPMQDVLGLGSEGRMNIPSVARGNWRWRMTGPAAAADAPRLREMAELYGRL
ncbi:MAG TPA: 4-alpha-glucanotransferase [Bryobacteraceae bacterium]|nr:4-alpha-glucanotransferase [Bryobacteraceae bacterium]